MKRFYSHLFKGLCFLLFLSYFQTVSGIGEIQSWDARSFSLGKIHALSDALSNPARLSFSDQKSIGLNVWNRFAMNELNTVDVHLKYPNRWVDAGAKFSTFGYSDYRLSQLQGLFSKKIRPDLAMGIHLKFLHESSIVEESDQEELSAGFGLFYRLNEQINFAFSGENLLATFKTKQWEIHLGGNYQMLDHAALFLETSGGKETNFQVSVGFEYAIMQDFLLRSGYCSLGKTPSFGLGYQWNKWRVDVGFALHNVLGMSSVIGINYML